VTNLRTNAQGTLVDTQSRAVTLDDARDYHVAVSASAMTPAPSASSGATVRVSNRTITVDPHIKALVQRDSGAALSGLQCELAIGSQTTNVTTSRGGWIWSNNRGAGAVTLRCDSRLLKAVGGANPQATLAVNPSPPVRGGQATITVTPPSGAFGFRVTQWLYEISHTNPGAAAASTSTVTRPASESSSTFHQSWAGTLCASGTPKARFVVGLTLRTAGSAGVSQTVIALDPLEAALAVTVSARTGAAWQSGLTENAEATLTRAINRFEDVGEHGWTTSGGNVTPGDITSGPNKGCQYVSGASVTFVSSPKINEALTNTASAFAQAQDKAYLVSPSPVRVIPSHLYTVGAHGAINITDAVAFSNWAGLAPGQQATFSGHCISITDLQTGTRRHEHTEANRSHKANCLKARRALDPIRFAEALVKLPGQTLNFQNTIQSRIRQVISVGATHDVVDEARSLADQTVAFIANQTIPAVNGDATGSIIGPVWNPTTNRELTN
jgi:hypothetical protein